MINTRYSMECDDCMVPLIDDETGDHITHPTVRGVNMAAYSRGWFVSPSDNEDHISFCPSCRVEARL
jgi:hypothetical protein